MSAPLSQRFRHMGVSNKGGCLPGFTVLYTLERWWQGVQNGFITCQTLIKIMEVRPENGPQYTAQGSKISVDPAAVVRERGNRCGRATCNSAGSVSGRAGPAGYLATGRRPIDSRGKCKRIVYCISKTEEGFTTVRDKNQCFGDKSTTKCCKRRCATCNFINTDNEVRSASTGYWFKIQQNSNCESKNVVYLLSCKKCGLQYVGETKRSLWQRFGEHKNSVKNKKMNTLMVQHFNQVGHSVEDMTIMVLHQNDNGQGSGVKGGLIQCEDFYIRLLNTVYPYGLNDKVKGYGCATEISNPTVHKMQPYFCHKFKRKNRGHGARKRRRPQRNMQFIHELQETYKNRHNMDGIISVVNYLKTQNKKTLSHFFRIIGQVGSKLSGRLQLLLLGYMSGYYKKMSECKGIERKDKYRLIVEFPNKGVELIQLSNIFLDKKLNKIIPIDIGKTIKKVAVVYKYEQPISRKLINYSKTLRNMGIKDVQNILESECRCSQSPFLYKQVGHVITGNLDIVGNWELREIFKKGSKYRLPKVIDWVQVERVAATAIIKYGNHLHKKYNVGFAVIGEYIERFMQIVKSRIVKERNRSSNYQMVGHFLPKNELNRLQSQFIIVQADKAAGNYVFVCKKYYIESICQELGVSVCNGGIQIIGNETYKPVVKSMSVLVNEHQDLVIKYGWEASVNKERKLELPILFATPKLHKNPYGWRFIAGSRFSTIRPVNILLHKVLGHLKRHFERYLKVIEKNTGYKHYWSVNNSQQVVEELESIQKKGAISAIVTCDFSTLFTKLPHQVIINCLYQLVEMCFRNSGKRYIMVKNTFCCYTDEVDSGKDTVCLKKEEVFEIIEVILNETYVQFGGQLFKQICGVPIGGNSSSLIADLALSVMEYRYITECVKERKPVPRGVRYVDDLNVLNSKEFMETAKDIYSKELVLNRTNSNYLEAAFLDMEIMLSDSLQYRIYNKTDDFSFEVVRYGFKESNVHSSMGVGVFLSQLTRFIRITNSLRDFEGRVSEMYNTFISHGFSESQLQSKFLLFAKQNRVRMEWLGIGSNSEMVRLATRIFGRVRIF